MVSSPSARDFELRLAVSGQALAQMSGDLYSGSNSVTELPFLIRAAVSCLCVGTCTGLTSPKSLLARGFACTVASPSQSRDRAYAPSRPGT